MTEQTPAERHEQNPAPASPTDKKDGAFSKIGSAVRKAAGERQAAKEESSRKQSSDAQAAGSLVTSGVFGTATVEIYEGGFVRIATASKNAQQPANISRTTPYEKLRSIKFTQPGQDQTSDFGGSLGPAMAGLMKGGKAFMKSSAPGLAMAGIAHLAKNESQKPFLTIVTDREIHTLVNQIFNGVVNRSIKGHNEVGLVLESAGNSVLRVVDLDIQPSRPESQPTFTGQPNKAPTLSERLRELADLHRDGILSDVEFAEAKGRLLAGL